MRIILAALTALLLGCAGMGVGPTKGRLPEGVAAMVNGEPIRRDEVERGALELERQAREANPGLNERGLARLRPEMLQMARAQAIDKIIVEQAIRREGIQIDDTLVEARIRAMDRTFQPQGLTVEGLRNSMQVSPERFRQMVRELLRVETFWDRRLGLKPPDEEALRKAYTRQRKEFAGAPAAHLYEVFVPYPAGRRPRRSERSDLRITAEALRARLLAGEPFAQVARDARGAKGSASPKSEEGDLGWVTPESPLPPAVLAAAFRQHPGQVGETIETEDGFHVLVVSERREARPISFAQAREWLADDMMREARVERIPGEIGRMRRQARIVVAQ